MDLFSTTSSTSSPVNATSPLAERVRPTKLEDVEGQEHLVGPGGILVEALKVQKIHSFILWGPPGSGKTTIARIVAGKSGYTFVPFSAVLSGIKEVKEVMSQAEKNRRYTGQRTVVFVDEIHRFNKAQQDAFLPFVERGDIILIGATTENPSFEIIGALLSRLRVYVLNPLRFEDQVKVLKRALEADRELSSKGISISDDVLEYLCSRVPGDARSALNLLETTSALVKSGQTIGRNLIDQASQRVALLYDKVGEEHYNVISALHKSMRNGDPDASLYWLGRMLESGEDPLYIARRMIRFASEDVGNADPQALILAVAARDAVHFLGLPEGKLALAELAAYLALAPKSNAVYLAYGRVENDLRAGHVYPVPLAIRNAPTKLMKNLGFGKDYEYAHDAQGKTTAMECLPQELIGRRYYEPSDCGCEKELGKRKKTFEEIRRSLKEGHSKVKE